MKRTYLSRAFTLIELLIVIAIIGLLTGIIVTSFSTPKSKSRDAKRISDLGQLQLALGLYFDRCKQYPDSLSTGATNGCPQNVTPRPNLGTYISTIPTPPTSPTGETLYKYRYFKSGDQVTDYVLATRLENYNEIIKDGLKSGSGAGSGWNGDTIVCSNTTVDTTVDYCVGPK